jgi:4-hydroxythreonine-4-phosphate dehydrogenase
VDHGTAFDQAGLGTASEASLINALDYAIGFARNRMADRPSRRRMIPY